MNYDNANDSIKQSNSENTINKPFRAASRDALSLEDFKNECLQAMANNDCPLNSRDLKTDGKLHRYSCDYKQNEPDEWYVAHEFNFVDKKGGTQYHLIVIYGSWSKNTKYKYRSWEKCYLYSFEDIQKLNSEFKQKSDEIAAKVTEEYNQKAKEAAQIWEKASLTAPDDSYKTYINKKGVDPLGIKYCLRANKYPSIIIPFKNTAGTIRALEYISIGADGKKYARCFGSRAGNFHTVDNKEIKNGDPIIVAEGWATAVSIFMAVGGIVCAVGGSNNIENVVENLRQAYPESQITIASDIGKGEQCAYEAAKNYAGTKIIKPEFPAERSIDPVSGEPYTDFNDLHKACDLKTVKQQLDKAESVKSYEEEIKEAAKEILKMSDPCETFSTGALPPVLRDYINDICETTDAHPLIVTSAALAAMTGLLNVRVVIPEGEYFQDLYLNLWFLTISKSGFFKSTALFKGGALAYQKNTEITKLIKLEQAKLLQPEYSKEDKEAIEEDIRKLKLQLPIVPSDITPEAFVKYLADGNMGVLFHNEFANFVQKAAENGLLQGMTDFYDMRPSRKLTKYSGDDIIDLPFFSICGVSTLAWLQDSLTKKANRDVHGGFYARFLFFIPPVKNNIPRGLPPKGKIQSIESRTIKQKYEALINQIAEDVKNQPRLFTLTPEAREIFSSPENGSGIHEILYGIVETNYKDQTKDILSSFLKRWSPEILKLAMLMELLYDPDSSSITPQSIRAAVHIVLPAIRSTAMLFETILGASEIRRQCNKIKEYIAKRGGRVSHQKLLNSDTLPLSAKEYKELLTTLIESGAIDKEMEMGGKTIYYALKKQEPE